MKAAPKFAHLRLDLLPAPLVANLRRGGVVRIPRTHKFLSPSVEQLVDADGDRALALLPVVVEGALIGVAGFAAARRIRVATGRHRPAADRRPGRRARRGARRASTSALHASEERFRAMCDASPLGIFLTDESGDCLYLNPAGQRIVGRSHEETLGQGWMNTLHPDDRALVISSLGRGGRGPPRLREARAPLRAQERRRAFSRGARGPDRGARPPDCISRYCSKTSPTACAPSRSAGKCWRAPRRRAPRPRPHARRRKPRARTSTTSCRASRTRSSRSIGDGRYTYANDRALTICGLPRDQLIGKSAWEIHPQLVGGPIHRAFLQAIAEQRSVTVEAPFGAASCTRRACTRRPRAYRSSSKTSPIASGAKSS